MGSFYGQLCKVSENKHLLGQNLGIISCDHDGLAYIRLSYDVWTATRVSGRIRTRNEKVEIFLQLDDSISQVASSSARKVMQSPLKHSDIEYIQASHVSHKF